MSTFIGTEPKVFPVFKNGDKVVCVSSTQRFEVGDLAEVLGFRDCSDGYFKYALVKNLKTLHIQELYSWRFALAKGVKRPIARVKWGEVGRKHG